MAEDIAVFLVAVLAGYYIVSHWFVSGRAY